MTDFTAKITTFFGSLMMMIGTLWLSSAFVSTAGSQQQQPPVQQETINPSLPSAPLPGASQSFNDPSNNLPQAVGDGTFTEDLTPTEGSDQAQSQSETREPRDPFRQFNKPIQQRVDPAAPARIGGVPASTVDPLLSSDVESFQVLAIVWNTEKPRALVQNASKVISKVERLTKIGRNNGFVAEIREGEIVIIEPVVQGSEIGAVTKILTMGVSK